MKHIFIIDEEKNENVDEIKQKIDALANTFSLDYIVKIVKGESSLRTVASYYARTNTIIYPVGPDSAIDALLTSVILDKLQKNNTKIGVLPIDCESQIYEKVNSNGKLTNKLNIIRVNDINTLNNVVIGLNSIFSKKFDITIDANAFLYDYNLVNGILLSDGIEILIGMNLLDKYNYIKKDLVSIDKVIDMSSTKKAYIYTNEQVPVTINDETIASRYFDIDMRYGSIEIVNNHQLTRNLVKK